MVKKLIILIIISFASLSYAKDDYDNFNSDGQDYSNFNNSADDKFRDWKNVLSLLSAKGVDTNSIDWNAVADSCSNIQNKTSGNAFNKCKYNSAINYDLYQKDSTYCDSESQQKYFDYIKHKNGGKNKSTLSKQEEKDFKDSASIVCMRNSGWNDSASWASGKSNIVRRHKNHR